MKKTRNIALLLAVMVFGFCVYSQAISLTVGSGDFYVNVGDHDYLPYAYNSMPGGQFGNLSFQTAMGDYGTWLSMQPFGQVWRPFVSNDWRPYTQGHWTYTQYGPTWQGYEPWAWAGYHYGNWVYSRQYGWVWIPGYEYHPGRVAWAQGYNSIGWMPLPPAGYDYSRGYLSHVGPQNQFTYFDDDFSIGIGFGNNNDYYYGGPYYDPRYRNMYYNPSYLNTVVGLLWTFLDPDHFGYDNYADYYYGGDYTRDLFDRRLVRISTRPVERVVLERIVRRPIQVRQVRTNEVQIDGRRVRLAAIEGEEERIRKNANRTVREVIAPAFAEKGRTFKAEKAKNRAHVERALRLENAPRRVETVTTEQIVRESREKNQRREQQRSQVRERKRQEVVQIERQGRIKEKRATGVRETEGEDNRSRSTRVPAEPPRNQNAEEQERERDQRLRPTTQPEERQARPENEREENIRRNRPVDEQEQEQERRRNRPDETPNDIRDRQNQDQDVRDAERQRETPVRPEADERRRSREDEEVSSDQEKKDAEAKSNKNQKRKSNKKQNKDKDKDKKQNQDEPPPE